MEEELFKIICEQVKAINELTAALQSGGGGTKGAVATKIAALPKRVKFNSNGRAVLDENRNRQGFIAVNKTADIVYGVANQDDATADYFTWDIASGDSEYYIPANRAYPGEVNFVAVQPGTGYLMITEFSYQ